MPLVCPNCENNKTFSTMGVQGFIKCAECGTGFPIEGNFKKEKENIFHSVQEES